MLFNLILQQNVLKKSNYIVEGPLEIKFHLLLIFNKSTSKSISLKVSICQTNFHIFT